MKRRSVFSLTVGIAMGAALPVWAQTERAARIGVLANFPASDPREASGWEGWQAFTDEMKRLGWEEGRNLVIERRFGMNDPQKYSAKAEELVAARVDVIYAPGSVATAAAFQATKSIPIVMHGAAAVELGYAKSLALPGGNVTGAVYQALDFTAKEFSLLKALRPDLKKIGLSTSRDNRLADLKSKDWQTVAGGQGVAVVLLPNMLTMADIEPMLVAAKREGGQALVVSQRLFLSGAGLQQINAWAVENKVLTYAGNWARGEVVVAFGPYIPDITRIAIGKIDRILRGANPADMPIEQPTRFELVINQKLATAMSLTIPQSVLQSATEVVK
jgi:putative tryptophan/tyrosine transport system substrate-binding protein